MILFAVDSLLTEDDRKFIEDLYNKYMPWLRSRAHRMVDDLNTCDDLAHDCMYNMMRYVDKLKSIPVDKQCSYLRISIDNTAINYLKRANRMVTMNEAASADLDFISDDCDIDYEIDKKCDYETLKKAIKLLDQRDQDIIEMKFGLELDDQHIADVLHIKKDCVRMTVLRSVKKLKKKINELEGK
ncbi:MAG: sigma-70 family RNA polymerase sigma factor [Clostridia bacterium]|nr:sigma-70 family RNA polymerase sigma factor [Clostridia bacterium]